MRFHQFPDAPLSVFLVPENAQDEFIIELLRRKGTNAFIVKNGIEGMAAEKLIDDAVTSDAYMDLIARVGNTQDLRRCPACDREGKLGQPPLCDKHLSERLRLAAKEVVELKILVNCDCKRAFNPKPAEVKHIYSHCDVVCAQRIGIEVLK